jgi:7-carboxy-7-deazaguanine synthase
MDVKLPGVSDESLGAKHQKFLRLCFDANLEIFIKIIVSQRIDSGELERSALLVIV